MTLSPGSVGDPVPQNQSHSTSARGAGPTGSHRCPPCLWLLSLLCHVQSWDPNLNRHFGMAFEGRAWSWSLGAEGERGDGGRGSVCGAPRVR